MFRLFCISVALLTLLHTQHVLAHGTPVVISTPGGKLAVDSLLYANLTEDDVIDNAPLPFGASLQYIIPGFDITGMVAGNQLSIELLPQTLTGLPGPQYLTFWSPLNGVSIAPNNQAFRVVSSFGQVSAFQDDTPVPPPLKIANVTNGVIGVHTHFLNYYLDDYVNAAAGLYALQVRLTSPQFQSSDPFWMMFDYNISGADVVMGSNEIMAAAANIVGPSAWIGASGDHWALAASWTGNVPNSASAEAKFSTTGGAVANLNVNQTVNKLTFDATTGNDYTLSGPGKLTLAGTTPVISTTLGNTGDQTIAVNLDLGAGTAINVNGGSLSLNASANSVLGAGVTATVATGATLNLGGTANALSNGTTTHANVANNGTLAATTAGKRVGNITGTGTTDVTAASATLTASSIRQAVLSIGATSTATVAPSLGNKSAGISVFTNTTGASLSIAAGGNFDTNDNDLIVYYQPGQGAATLATIQQQIIDGFLNTPAVAKISSSTGAVDGDKFLVAIDNGAIGLSSWEGVSLTGSNQIIAKYTLFGDLNLDGAVDSFDYSVIDSNFGTGNSWLSGDSNLDGVVNSFDYSTVDTNFGKSFPSMGGGAANLSIAAVPEPSTLFFMAVAFSIVLICHGYTHRTQLRL